MKILYGHLFIIMKILPFVMKKLSSNISQCHEDCCHMT